MGIHSRRDASAALGVGDRVWGGATGTRGGAAGTAKEMLGASVGVVGPATACLSTLARASRSGAWGEVRTAAARITGTRARNCGELGGSSLNEAGSGLKTSESGGYRQEGRHGPDEAS